MQARASSLVRSLEALSFRIALAMRNPLFLGDMTKSNSLPSPAPEERRNLAQHAIP